MIIILIILKCFLKSVVPKVLKDLGFKKMPRCDKILKLNKKNEKSESKKKINQNSNSKKKRKQKIQKQKINLNTLFSNKEIIKTKND